jgi:hypothetical protein
MNSAEAKFTTSLEQVEVKSVYERAKELGESAINALQELFVISEEHPYIASSQINKVVASIPSRFLDK